MAKKKLVTTTPLLASLSREDLILVIRDLLCGAFEHLDAVRLELAKVATPDMKDDPEKAARARVMTLTMVCINDIIHPAYDLALEMFEKEKELLTMYMKSHTSAMEQGMVPPCKCRLCEKKSL